MKQRCENPNNTNYLGYGGRGISVAPELQTFEGFYAELGACPPGMSLDRIDNMKGYQLGNVRWTDTATQSTNKRNNVLLTIGASTKPVSVWAKEIGISQQLVHARLRLGWSDEQAVMTPPYSRRVA